ncbi:hypothetical protein GJ496_010359 [Pomphorhynchus laevis]|nr:hypothetical protein GJ496_010359 [Pomphorhynchus laevis]
MNDLSPVLMTTILQHEENTDFIVNYCLQQNSHTNILDKIDQLISAQLNKNIELGKLANHNEIGQCDLSQNSHALCLKQNQSYYIKSDQFKDKSADNSCNRNIAISSDIAFYHCSSCHPNRDAAILCHCCFTSEHHRHLMHEYSKFYISKKLKGYLVNTLCDCQTSVYRYNWCKLLHDNKLKQPDFIGILLRKVLLQLTLDTVANDTCNRHQQLCSNADSMINEFDRNTASGTLKFTTLAEFIGKLNECNVPKSILMSFLLEEQVNPMLLRLNNLLRKQYKFVNWYSTTDNFGNSFVHTIEDHLLVDKITILLEYLLLSALNYNLVSLFCNNVLSFLRIKSMFSVSFFRIVFKHLPLFIHSFLHEDSYKQGCKEISEIQLPQWLRQLLLVEELFYLDNVPADLRCKNELRSHGYIAGLRTSRGNIESKEQFVSLTINDVSISLHSIFDILWHFSVSKLNAIPPLDQNPAISSSSQLTIEAYIYLNYISAIFNMLLKHNDVVYIFCTDSVIYLRWLQLVTCMCKQSTFDTVFLYLIEALFIATPLTSIRQFLEHCPGDKIKRHQIKTNFDIIIENIVSLLIDENMPLKKSYILYRCLSAFVHFKSLLETSTSSFNEELLIVNFKKLLSTYCCKENFLNNKLQLIYIRNNLAKSKFIDLSAFTWYFLYLYEMNTLIYHQYCFNNNNNECIASSIKYFIQEKWLSINSTELLIFIKAFCEIAFFNCKKKFEISKEQLMISAYCCKNVDNSSDDFLVGIWPNQNPIHAIQCWRNLTSGNNNIMIWCIFSLFEVYVTLSNDNINSVGRRYLSDIFSISPSEDLFVWTPIRSVLINSSPEIANKMTNCKELHYLMYYALHRMKQQQWLINDNSQSLYFIVLIVIYVMLVENPSTCRFSIDKTGLPDWLLAEISSINHGSPYDEFINSRCCDSSSCICMETGSCTALMPDLEKSKCSNEMQSSSSVSPCVCNKSSTCCCRMPNSIASNSKQSTTLNSDICICDSKCFTSVSCNSIANSHLSFSPSSSGMCICNSKCSLFSDDKTRNKCNVCLFYTCVCNRISTICSNKPIFTELICGCSDHETAKLEDTETSLSFQSHQPQHQDHLITDHVDYSCVFKENNLLINIGQEIAKSNIIQPINVEVTSIFKMLVQLMSEMWMYIHHDSKCSNEHIYVYGLSLYYMEYAIQLILSCREDLRPLLHHTLDQLANKNKIIEEISRISCFSVVDIDSSAIGFVKNIVKFKTEQSKTVASSSTTPNLNSDLEFLFSTATMATTSQYIATTDECCFCSAILANPREAVRLGRLQFSQLTGLRKLRKALEILPVTNLHNVTKCLPGMYLCFQGDVVDIRLVSKNNYENITVTDINSNYIYNVMDSVLQKCYGFSGYRWLQSHMYITSCDHVSHFHCYKSFTRSNNRIDKKTSTDFHGLFENVQIKKCNKEAKEAGDAATVKQNPTLFVCPKCDSNFSIAIPFYLGSNYDLNRTHDTRRYTFTMQFIADVLTAVDQYDNKYELSLSSDAIEVVLQLCRMQLDWETVSYLTYRFGHFPSLPTVKDLSNLVIIKSYIWSLNNLYSHRKEHCDVCPVPLQILFKNHQTGITKEFPLIFQDGLYNLICSCAQQIHAMDLKQFQHFVILNLRVLIAQYVYLVIIDRYLSLGNFTSTLSSMEHNLRHASQNPFNFVYDLCSKSLSGKKNCNPTVSSFNNMHKYQKCIIDLCCEYMLSCALLRNALFSDHLKCIDNLPILPDLHWPEYTGPQIEEKFSKFQSLAPYASLLQLIEYTLDCRIDETLDLIRKSPNACDMDISKSLLILFSFLTDDQNISLTFKNTIKLQSVIDTMSDEINNSIFSTTARILQCKFACFYLPRLIDLPLKADQLRISLNEKYPKCRNCQKFNYSSKCNYIICLVCGYISLAPPCCSATLTNYTNHINKCCANIKACLMLNATDGCVSIYSKNLNLSSVDICRDIEGINKSMLQIYENDMLITERYRCLTSIWIKLNQ